MLKTNIDLRRAVLYAVSGGLLTAAFGVLGAAGAEAAPLPGDRPEPGGTPAQQNAEKVQMNKHRAANVKQKQQQTAKVEEGKNREAEKKRTDTYNKRFPNGEKGGSSADWKDTRPGDRGEREAEGDRKEQVKKDQTAKAEEGKNREAEKKRTDTYNKRFPNGEKGGSSADWKDTRPGDRGEREAEGDRKEQEAEKRKAGPVKGLRVIDYDQEVDQATDAAIERADRLAKERDKGAVGSVRAWETTSKLAGEAAVEAEQWKKFRGPTVKWLPVPEKKKPTIRRGPQPAAAPVQGMRAFEVGQEISAAAEPAKAKAEALKALRDEAPAGSKKRAVLAEEFKQANRDAAWLEYVDEAGTPLSQKIASGAWNDISNWAKSIPAVLDEGVDVGLGLKSGKSEKAYRDATRVAHTAADDLAEFKDNVKNPDGSIPPEHRTELGEKRAALANATNSASDAYHAKVRMDKFAKRAGGAVSTGVTVGGIAYDKLVEGKTDGEAIFGSLGGEIGSMAGAAVPGPLRPVGSFLGGFVGSAVGEESYKAIRDSGKDIDDIVKDAEQD